MPVDRLQKEYDALTKSAVLLDLSSMGKIEVSGPDSADFLHNILSNDIKNLKPDSGCQAALLHATGKILAFMTILRRSDSFFLIVEAKTEQTTLELLNRYLITENVTIADKTSDYLLLGIEGPEAFNVSRTIFPEIPVSLDFLTQKEITANGKEILIFACSRTGQKGLHFLIPKPATGELLNKIRASCPALNLETQEIARIEAGILRHGIDFDETVLLPETGLEKIAASETKGCYPGQEVVAKIETYGRLNRKLTGLILAGEKPVSRNDPVFTGSEEAGYITSSIFSPTLKKAIAISLLKKGYYDQGVKVKIQTKGGELNAMTASFPFSGTVPKVQGL